MGLTRRCDDKAVTVARPPPKRARGHAPGVRFHGRSGGLGANASPAVPRLELPAPKGLLPSTRRVASSSACPEGPASVVATGCVVFRRPRRAGFRRRNLVGWLDANVSPAVPRLELPAPKGLLPSTRRVGRLGANASPAVPRLELPAPKGLLPSTRRVGWLDASVSPAGRRRSVGTRGSVGFDVDHTTGSPRSPSCATAPEDAVAAEPPEGGVGVGRTLPEGGAGRTAPGGGPSALGTATIIGALELPGPKARERRCT